MKSKSFNLNAFTKLPSSLHPADYIDFFNFLNSSKPSIRFFCNNAYTIESLYKWCKLFGYKLLWFDKELVYISKFNIFNMLVSKVDNSYFSHTFVLGILLGYPYCCAKKLAKIGEVNIDDWEIKYFSKNIPNDLRNLINPLGYHQGSALISHVPCSWDCKASLNIALKNFRTIKNYHSEKCFERWQMYF